MVIFVLAPVRAYSARPVSVNIHFGEIHLLDNNLNQSLIAAGYRTVDDKRGAWGMGANGRLIRNIYWNIYIDFYSTKSGYSNFYSNESGYSDISLYISHSLFITGFSYKLFEKEKFRVMPGIGLGVGQSLVEVTPLFSSFNPFGTDIDEVMENPFGSTVFGKEYFLFNAQIAFDKSLYLGTDKQGIRYMFLLGMRTGIYMTIAESAPDLNGVRILNFSENNLDNYYLNFIIGMQFR
jgi:hypothetical protein